MFSCGWNSSPSWRGQPSWGAGKQARVSQGCVQERARCCIWEFEVWECLPSLTARPLMCSWAIKNKVNTWHKCKERRLRQNLFCQTCSSQPKWVLTGRLVKINQEKHAYTCVSGTGPPSTPTNKRKTNKHWNISNSNKQTLCLAYFPHPDTPIMT